MRVIRDYRCGDCSAVSEHWANNEELATLRCPDCGGSTLTAIIAAPKLGITASVANGEASSDGLGTMVDKWAKMRAQKLKTEKRNLERHGTHD